MGGKHDNYLIDIRNDKTTKRRLTRYNETISDLCQDVFCFVFITYLI